MAVTMTAGALGAEHVGLRVRVQLGRAVFVDDELIEVRHARDADRATWTWLRFRTATPGDFTQNFAAQWSSTFRVPREAELQVGD